MRAESPRPSRSSMGGWIHILKDKLPAVTIMAKPQKTQKDWTPLAMEMASSQEAKSNLPYLAKRLGVGMHSLQALMVGYGYDTYRKEWFSSWPEFGSSGMAVGIIRRYPDGSKRMMEGGNHGIYYSGWNARDGSIYIVEGGSDTAALIGLGANAIGRPSCLGGLRECTSMLRADRREVIVVGERDEKPDKRGKLPHCPAVCKSCMHCWPGLAGARLFAERLQLALKREVLYGLLPNKDAREWVLNARATTQQELRAAIRIGEPAETEGVALLSGAVP